MEDEQPKLSGIWRNCNSVKATEPKRLRYPRLNIHFHVQSEYDTVVLNCWEIKVMRNPRQSMEEEWGMN